MLKHHRIGTLQVISAKEKGAGLLVMGSCREALIDVIGD